MKPLGRLLTAMITPFQADESVNLPEARRLAAWLLSEGNDGLIVAGTTGEGPVLDMAEKLALFAAVREAAGARGSVVANTGNNDTRSSVKLTREAKHTGVDGILAVVPYYNKPTQEGMLRHFGAIAEATELPIIIYNVPGRTCANMLPQTLLELARRHGNIAGVKESSGDFSQFTAILRDRQPDFRFWVGDDPYFLPSLAIGGDGLISVAAHICARELRALLTCFDQGDLAGAARIHQSLATLTAELFAITNPIPVKWAMKQLGFAAGEARSPLASLPPERQQRLQEMLTPYLERAVTPVS